MTEAIDQPGRLLPTLPGKVRGIVGMDASGRRTAWDIQCERCFTVERVTLLVLMRTKFHPRSTPSSNPRLCLPCRIEVYADCYCDNCKSDRK